VAKLDNPAGRLYEILAEYRRTATKTKSVVDHWVAVFEVEDRDTALLRVAETAGLIPQIEAALIRSADEDQMHLFRTFADDLIHAVIHPRTDTYSSQSQAVVVQDQPLAALGGISSFLTATASEGRVPSDNEITDLRSQVQELIAGITEDPALPEEIKRAALDHAYRLAQALDHFRIGGPGAVKAATERLIGATVLAPPHVRESKWWQRLLAVGGAIWTVVKMGPEAQKALEAWEGLIKALPGGPS
jgi:hypothetical protein